jgi:hypothetical protein
MWRRSQLERFVGTVEKFIGDELERAIDFFRSVDATRT